MKELPKNELVRALSWKQPYAGLMLKGKIETRTWETEYRGLVMICASKISYRVDAISLISGPVQLDRVIEQSEKLHASGGLINGHAIAVGRLVDCRPMKRSDEVLTFVEYHPDLFCHIYQDVTAIKPIPWKGTQGWKTVPDAIIQQIQFL